MLSFLAAAALLASSPAPLANTHPFPEDSDMQERIRKADARLFWAFFEGCDPDLQAEFIHPDFRMVHDLEGLAIPDREFMLKQARERCEARKPGGSSEGYSSRRLLVPGSRIIRRMGRWGALEQGLHTFHEWRADQDGDGGEWEMTGGARYMHVWQWMPEEGRFRLLESLSYDHGAAQPYPPALD